MIKFPVFFANIYPLYRMYWAARVLEIPARGFDSYFYGRFMSKEINIAPSCSFRKYSMLLNDGPSVAILCSSNMAVNVGILRCKIFSMESIRSSI